MKRKLITAAIASVCILSFTATSTMASQLNEGINPYTDYNTTTSCYNDSTGRIHVIDADNENAELFEMKDVGEIVYTTEGVNLRKNPTINQKPYAALPKGIELLRVGIGDNGWSMVQVDEVNYFIATVYLTTKEPDKTIIEWDLTDYLIEKPAEKPAPQEEGTPNPTGGLTYLGDWTISFYCNCSICCGQWAGGATASGTTPTQGRTIACGSLPFGTHVYIDGWGEFIVEDRGVSGNWIDMYRNDHNECNALGLQTRGVYLVG